MGTTPAMMCAGLVSWLSSVRLACDRAASCVSREWFA